MFRAFLFFIAAGVACAGPLFVGSLNGPGAGTDSAGFGFAVVSVANDELSMSVEAFYGDLQGAATSAFLVAGGLFPLLLPNPADTTGSVNGTFTIDAGVVAALFAGSGLVTIGSTAFPGGEIAGLVRFSEPPRPREVPPEIPEPGTLALLVPGLTSGCVKVVVPSLLRRRASKDR